MYFYICYFKLIYFQNGIPSNLKTNARMCGSNVLHDVSIDNATHHLRDAVEYIGYAVE